MSLSRAQQAQKAHWQLLGSIARCKGLLAFHLRSSPHMPLTVRSHLEMAMRELQTAWWKEAENNEFINLKLPRGF